MPIYALTCTRCGRKLRELTATMAEREEMRCPKMDCSGELENDYARHDTSSFQLKGADWPGQENRLAGKIMRERNID